jgi:uncharacterized cupin superfamily protein
VQRFNLFEAEFAYDESDPEGYRSGMDRFGAKIGARRLGGSVYEIPPGQSICPYHYEYGDEEWLVVLEGRPLVRHPGGEEELAPGEVVCFPAGPEGAHKVTNRGSEPIRVLMVSTMRLPSVAVYPDSDKIGFFPGKGASLLFRRPDSVEYYEGEAPGGGGPA